MKISRKIQPGGYNIANSRTLSPFDSIIYDGNISTVCGIPTKRLDNGAYDFAILWSKCAQRMFYTYPGAKEIA